MTSTAKAQGRNWTSEYSDAGTAPDRCRKTKNYGSTVCADKATTTVIQPGFTSPGFDHSPIAGRYCAFHGPLVVKAAKRERGVEATLVADGAARA